MSVGENDAILETEVVSAFQQPQHQQQQQQQSLSAGNNSRTRSRQSPEGRDREFPATRIRGSSPKPTRQQQPPSQQQPRTAAGGDNNIMGGGDDRYYHSNATAAGGQPGNAGVRCPAGQLGQSRDFHYSVQDHHGSGGSGTNSTSGYRTASSSSSSSGRPSSSSRHDTSGYHHVSGGSGGGGSRSRPSRDYYLEAAKAASPYHHAPSGSGGSSTSSRSQVLRTGTSSVERQDYAILRQRHQQAAAAAAAAANAAAVAAAAVEYEHRLTHHSGSRSDLLEHDHNAVMYEHGLASASPYGVPAQTQYTFVRMCDGKFVRTAIPLHDFDAMEGSGYYRMAAASVNHTMRRPTKRHSSAAASALAAAVAASGGGGSGSDTYACCPRVDDLARSRAAPAATYATLRGQKWAHRQKAGCGIGDNYGRGSATALSYHDDARSITDDFLAMPPRSAPATTSTELHHLPPPNVGLSLTASGKLISRGGVVKDGPGGLSSASLMLSRSTDRNLDNLGLDDDEDEDDLEDDEEDEDDDDLFPVRTSDEALSLLTREPPDGKEKPEPIKSSLHKMETLSRKSSKCDLLPTMGGNNNSNNSTNNLDACRSEATSICGDTSSVLSGSTMMVLDRAKTEGKRDSLSSGMAASITGVSGGVKDNSGVNSGNSLFPDGILPPPPSMNLSIGQDDMDMSGLGSSSDYRKPVPNSPRCGPMSNLGPLMSGSSMVNSSAASSSATSPKTVSVMSASLPMSAAAAQASMNMGRAGLSRVGSNRDGGLPPPPEVMAMSTRSIIQYGGAATPTTSGGLGVMAAVQPQQGQQQQQHAGQLAIASGQQARVALNWHQTIRAFVFGGTAKFFGVHATSEEISRLIWNERRRRLAVKRFGGVKDDFHLDGGAVYGTQQYGDSGTVGLSAGPMGNVGGMAGNINAGNSGVGSANRLRYDHHLTSELEGDKMVLKITKPPRNKDSFSSLTGQTLSWLLKSMMTRKVPSHHIISEHDVSRSYQPSTTGIAAYYQAEQAGGLAVCPPLPRVPSSHHLYGESPAEEVFFTKPTCDGDEGGNSGRLRVAAYTSDPYRSCSWQLPRPEADMPRMSSDVGASRIWNRLLDAAFDNSDRRKHGMGILGRMSSTGRRRATRRSPESNRKRKLGGNSGDHRPYFTYWMTFVQIFILLISLITYGIGPVGIDLYKKAGMVLVTNLELEPVAHLEPANFWIGPSVANLIHLGAKYAPCMRWDEVLDREIREERLKERDTACCIRKDRAGCVQSPKTECSKYGDPTGSTPRSNWWRPSEWYSKYPNENRRSSGPVCGLDPAYCEAPASVAPYIWPDDITKWPICRRKTDMETIEGQTAEHMICEVIGHPCCIGIRGQCKITTKEYCMFVGGTFHEEAALCSQVSCLDDVCGLLPFRNRDVPDQFYRVWTPLFLHAGILHLALTVALQYWLMRDLEKMAGAARIALIYMGSGMVGNLASAIFVPYRAEVGPAGAHFGLLACCMVEVIHQWHMLKYPEMAILKLVGITAVFFLAGLLPWVDNYAHLFGFIFGFLLSYAILPFVTFGRLYDRRRKLFLIVVCLTSSILLFVGLLLLFYITPIHDCEICKYFNCIPITKDFCADQNIDLRVDG